MSLIDEIIAELKIRHGETKFEIEKVIDSQYKVMQESIQDRKDIRVINIMHIGKFKPTFYYKKRYEEELLKEAKGDIRGLEELNCGGSSSGGDSSGT
jgi:hypothetical protein